MAAGRLVIAQAAESDAADWVDLQRTVLEEGRWFITEVDELTEGPEEKAVRLRDLGRQVNSLALVARVEGRMAGVLVVAGGVLRRMRHCGKLEILVHPEYRGQGIGRALMEAGLQWAQENPVITKVALSVMAHNTRAIALYEKLGFQREGHRPREYRLRDGTFWDDVLMFRFV